MRRRWPHTTSGARDVRTDRSLAVPVGWAAGAIIGLMVLLACAARLIHLDADPHFPTWISYVVDEGRWNESARNLALFGTTDAFAGRVHLLLSPGYQAGNYVAFRLFGVDFMSARASAAIAGVLVVFSVFVALRRHVKVLALALGVIILGFETNMLAESRMALPEIPSVLASLLAFLVLVLGRKTKRNAFVAGVLAAIAVAMKGTSVLVAPVFPLIILLTPQGGSARPRLVHTGVFLCGFALPLLAGLGAALALGLIDIDNVTSSGARFLSFLSLVHPGIAMWSIFEGRAYEARNLMLLAAWFCSWLWCYRGSNTPSVVRDLYLMSGLWAAWCFIVWWANEYSPGRYVVHLIVPATIHVVAGLSLADHETLSRIAAGFRRRSGVARAALFAWLALPTAVLLATALAGFAAFVAWDLSRLSSRIALIAVLAGLIGIVPYRNESMRVVVAGFLTFPVLATVLWLGGRDLQVFHQFWEFNSAAAVAAWTVTMGLALAASVVLAIWPHASHVLAGASVLVLIAGIFLAQAAPAIFAPTYSIRDASRDLGRQLATAHDIRTVAAASLFLENTLRYRERRCEEIDRDDKRCDAMVVFEHNLMARKFLQSAGAAHLNRVRTYPLKIHPHYEVNEGKDGPAQIALYRRRQADAYLSGRYPTSW